MTSFDEAVSTFFEGFGVPAFAGFAFVQKADGRRKRPAFPYITYELKRPAFGQTTVLHASVWDRHVSEPNSRRRTNEILQKIEQKVPEGGVLLRFDGGSAWIKRANNFIEYMPLPDPDDPLIVRGLVGFEVSGFGY